MIRLLSSIKKEILLVSRDRAGLIIMFLMPMVLIFVMTLIQDSTFRKLDDSKLELIFLDLDHDSLAASMERGLKNSGFFKVIKSHKGIDVLDEESMRRIISEGKYQSGIIVSEDATKKIRKKAQLMINELMYPEDSLMSASNSVPDSARIAIYFDPIINNAFKHSVKNAIDNLAFQLETKIFFDVFSTEISDFMPGLADVNLFEESSIYIDENYALNKYTEIIPNSVQHNVPAWAVFAMFFIIIPLTANIIREKNSGIALRLKLMPDSFFILLFAKVFVYQIICFIQFALMLVVGIVFLPMLGLPILEIGDNVFALIIIAATTALAATGYGYLIGTLSTSHEQAASFGSVSVIILAALGGIWIPVFMMPGFMKTLSKFSPLNWGLEGFQAIFVRGEGLNDVMYYASLLLGFFIFTILVSYFYPKLNDR